MPADVLAAQTTAPALPGVDGSAGPRRSLLRVAADPAALHGVVVRRRPARRGRVVVRRRQNRGEVRPPTRRPGSRSVAIAGSQRLVASTSRYSAGYAVRPGWSATFELSSRARKSASRAAHPVGVGPAMNLISRDRGAVRGPSSTRGTPAESAQRSITTVSRRIVEVGRPGRRTGRARGPRRPTAAAGCAPGGGGGAYGFIVANRWPMKPSGVQLIIPIVPPGRHTRTSSSAAGLMVRREHRPDSRTSPRRSRRRRTAAPRRRPPPSPARTPRRGRRARARVEQLGRQVAGGHVGARLARPGSRHCPCLRRRREHAGRPGCRRPGRARGPSVGDQIRGDRGIVARRPHRPVLGLEPPARHPARPAAMSSSRSSVHSLMAASRACCPATPRMGPAAQARHR